MKFAIEKRLLYSKQAAAVVSTTFVLICTALFIQFLMVTNQTTQAQVCSDTVVVTSTADAGPGTVRQALVDVCPFGTVEIDNTILNQTVNLESPLLISNDMTITSSGPFILSGQTVTRVMHINASVDVTLDGLTLQDGRALTDRFPDYYAGGLYIETSNAVVTLTNSIVRNNESIREGGGIYARGTVNVIDSLIEGNTAGRSGGGLYARGGLNVTDSTFASNSTSSLGGGIYVFGGEASVTTSTFVDNEADAGGGLFNDNILNVSNSTLSSNRAEDGAGLHSGEATTTTIAFTTVYGNEKLGDGHGGSGVDNDGLMSLDHVLIGGGINGPDCVNFATLAPVANSLHQDGTCPGAAVDAGFTLPALADNGGGTETHALLTGNPAIDAGTATCVATDQRGISRPVGAACDIGAFEFESVPDIEIAGLGLPILNGTTATSAADNTDFGSVQVNAVVNHQFTISNQGNIPLNLSNPAVTVSGGSGAFSVTAAPTSPVAAAGNTTFAITFNPPTPGEYLATISVGSDDPDENPYTFAVSGSVIAPEIAVIGNGQVIANNDTTPSANDGTDFGVLATGLSRTFTISNPGTADLILTGIPLVILTGSSDFSITSLPSSPVRPGETTTFEVTYNPIASGTATANISIQSNDLDEGTTTFVVQGSKAVEPLADLNIVKSDDVDPVAPGGTLTYQIVVENNGNVNAATVAISDTLPANTTYVPNSITGGDTRSDSFLPVLGWIQNSLAPGQSITLTYQVTVDNGLANGVSIANTASVTTTTPNGGSGSLVDTISTTVDDGTSAVIEFTGATFNAVENGGSANITLQMTPASDAAVTVEVDVTELTTLADPIVSTGVQTVTFAPGATTASLALTLFDDAVYEGNQFVQLQLQNPTGAVVGGTDQAILTVTDNDTPPTVSVADVTAPESNSDSLDFVISLSAAAGVDVSVDYATADGTATAGSDYLASSGTALIPAGSLSTTVSVDVLEDTAAEVDETILFSLSAPLNSTIGDGAGVGTILDDDGDGPTLSNFVFLPFLQNSRTTLGPPPMTPYPDLVVDSIDASSTNIAVTLRNAGNQAVVNSFWVDLYINPTEPPTRPNEIVETLGIEGVVWGVQIDDVSLEPGETLTLTLNDQFMSESYSNFNGLPAGSTVYVQVDSARVGSQTGNVLETHEVNGEPYNNIASVVTQTR